MPFSVDVRLPRAWPRPRTFDLTVGKRHVDCEFANGDYAARFRLANPAEGADPRA